MENYQISGCNAGIMTGAPWVVPSAAVWRGALSGLRILAVIAVRDFSHVDVRVYDLCDQMGLMVMDESFDTWTAAKPEALLDKSVL